MICDLFATKRALVTIGDHSPNNSVAILRFLKFWNHCLYIYCSFYAPILLHYLETGIKRQEIWQRQLALEQLPAILCTRLEMSWKLLWLLWLKLARMERNWRLWASMEHAAMWRFWTFCTFARHLFHMIPFISSQNRKPVCKPFVN